MGWNVKWFRGLQYACGSREFQRARVLVLLAGVALLFPSYLLAQVSTASVNGTVQDPSGAVISHASIVLRNISTGIERTTTTNATGNYVILNVNPGKYSLQASRHGFAPSKRSGITLTVNQAATFNFTLSVGSASQTVTVKATTVQLQASTSELGSVIDHQAVIGLPLNGRNFTQLLALTPGASIINTGQNASYNRAPAVGAYTIPAINGMSNRSNMFLMDGINDLASETSSYNVPPIVDDIQEFKVDSHNDQAEFGGVLGGVVNVVTKSGTNQFHGTLWEFVRNTAFDARDPFRSSVTPFTQNQFGGNIGGPVLLPHYNGRNRTFFFFGIEQFISHVTGQTVFLDPTPAQFKGDFSAVPQQLYNPFSTRPDPNKPGGFIRDPFPNNQIPVSLLNPHAVAFQSLYPAPVAETGVPGLHGLATTPSVTNSLGYDLRIDEHAGMNNSFWFRFSRNRDAKQSKQVFVGLDDSTIFPAYNLGVNWLHTFGSKALLQAQFGRNKGYRVTQNFISGDTSKIVDGFSPLFVNGSAAGKSKMVPLMSFTGYHGGGENYAGTSASDIYQGKVKFSLIAGNHTISLGGEVATNNMPLETDVAAAESFSPFQTSNPENRGKTGDAFASFLLGVPNTASSSNRVTLLGDGWVDGVYFQDQWKTTKNLTLNLGVRYDVAFMPVALKTPSQSEMTGSLNLNNGTYVLEKAVASLGSCETLGKAPCIPGGVLPDHVVISKKRNLLNNDYKNVEPRLGIAYALNSKTAIRGGIGTFTDSWGTMEERNHTYSGNWPSIALVRASNLNTTVPTATFENPLGFTGTSGALPAANPFNQVEYYADPNLKTPYVAEWNLGVQRLLGNASMLTINYVGSKGIDLPCCGAALYNTAPTPGPGSPKARAPYPYITPTHYIRSVAWSNYNALQVSMERRASNLTYLISYTWSKAMNSGCDGFFDGCDVQNPYDIKAAYSVAGYDLPNVLTASWVYKLPFGVGQRFAINNGPLNYLVEGWELNGITTFTSGRVFSIGYSGDVANTGNNVQWVNLVGNPRLANRTKEEWFNTSAFQAPAPYTWGDNGRHTLRADWYKDFDLSVVRNFPITESSRVQFRAEAFNAFNDPTWGNPDTTFNSRLFGKVTSTRSTSRELQFALKLYF